MLSVVQEENPPRAPLHQVGDEWCIGLGRIAVPAGKNQVVRTVIGGLTPAGPDVIECDRLLPGLGAAICTHGAVLSEQPIAV
jgi:hypothetical protein